MLQLQQPIEKLRPLGRYASGAAWLFIIVSLAHLAWATAATWVQPGLVTLYQTTVDGETHRAWGLAYDGWTGRVQPIVQGLLVIAAAVATVLPWLKGRRIGHGLLMAWAGLWMANLIWLASLDGRIDSVGQAGVASVFFAATVVRAAMGWNGRRPRRPLESDAAEMEMEMEMEPEPEMDPAPEPLPPLEPPAPRRRLALPERLVALMGTLRAAVRSRVRSLHQRLSETGTA